MHTSALLAIICLGLVTSVAHVDAGARQPAPEDLGYYDDNYSDGSIFDAIGGFIMAGLFWVLVGVILFILASIGKLIEWLHGRPDTNESIDCHECEEEEEITGMERISNSRDEFRRLCGRER